MGWQRLPEQFSQRDTALHVLTFSMNCSRRSSMSQLRKAQFSCGSSSCSSAGQQDAHMQMQHRVVNQPCALDMRRKPLGCAVASMGAWSNEV
jgi:hypothetical protein